MQAVLGLAVSHLLLTTGQNLHAVALFRHRILAIRGSNDAISQASRTSADRDALIGTCYALIFQSTYMDDGKINFFRIVPGCRFLTLQLKSEGIAMAFGP